MVPPTRRHTIAVVGTGTVGRSWVRVFTRAGYETRIWDPDPAAMDEARAWLKADLKVARKRQGLRKAAARSQRELVTRCATLEETVADVSYVQECAPDELRPKQDLFARLDRHCPERTILASSTARFDIAAITADLPGRRRALLAHALRLPHTVPAVEVCPGPETDPAVVRRTVRFLSRVGQHPVVLKRFVPGLAADRLEAALLAEAARLVEQEVADLTTVEALVHDGLGLRWALLGPWGQAQADADGGLGEWLDGAEWLRARWADGGPPPALTPELAARLARAAAAMSGGVSPEEQRLWRDDLISRIRWLKAANPVREDEPEE